MFRSIFRPYGPVWNFLNHVTDALGLSLLWCLCSLPVITMGAATTALYDAAVRGIRYREEGVYRRFFRTFRSSLKTGCAFTALWGVILLFGSFVLYLLDQAALESTQAALMAGAYRVLLLLPVGGFCWSAIILSRFSQRFRDLTGIALRFLPGHPFATLVILLLTWLFAWQCLENLLLLTFLPAVIVIGWSLAVEPVFRKLGAGLKEESAES